MQLYIHIPFCSSKCGYCAFNSFVSKQESYAPYINALCKDITASLNALKERAPNTTLQSVFIGGGTPNVLDSTFYQKIFACFKEFLDSQCEISIESNVNLITRSWCEDLIAMGANRLSIGVQSFNAKKLAFLEREHCIKDIFKAFENAQKSGFKNINCDIIFGTPLDDKALIQSECDNLEKLPLTHISAYCLSIDEGSRFALKSPPKENLSQNCITQAQILKERFFAQGFRQYEVSNYAKEGYICKHNLAYWQGKEYVGCGCGAVGRIKNVRYKANTALQEYIDNPHFREKEILSKQDLDFEEIMLGLRCEVGVDCQILNPQNLQILIESNQIYIQKNGIKNMAVARNFLLADEITLWLSEKR